MDARFGSAQASHLVSSLAGVTAFVPPPLPPEITFTAELVTLLSNADRALHKRSSRW